MPCFCGDSRAFEECCLPFINGSQTPQTAEQLMRSRYTAFKDNHADYLVATHWPVDLETKASIQKTIETTQFVGLKIIKSQQGGPKDNKGKVEFIAFYEESGIQQLHEISDFEKHNNLWFYTQGKPLGPIKIGRNDLCFCASGKKFKRCHANQS